VAETPPWVTESYPSGYENWPRFSGAQVERSELGEIRGLYLNEVATLVGNGIYPVGSVLVKAQYRAESSGKGLPFQISVMRKEGGKQQHGWTFAVYDPKRYMQVSFDQDVCLVCHSQRADHDFVFSRYGKKP
jgi:hypothetical protein